MLMLARNLKYPPKQEDMGPVAMLLVEDLIDLKLTNEKVISESLTLMGRTFEEWPSTALIINIIRGKHGTERMRTKQIEYDEPKTPEQKRNIRKIIRMTKSILKRPSKIMSNKNNKQTEITEEEEKKTQTELKQHYKSFQVKT